MDAHQRVDGSAGDHVVEGAEIGEHFLGAGLDALGAGSVEAALGLVDDADVEPASGEVDGQRGADGPGTDDENVKDGLGH